MDELRIRARPNLFEPTMVLGFTGWMDGGSVSTGTVGYIAERLQAESFAWLEPYNFYILNFPFSAIPISIHASEGKAVLTSVSSMEVASIFRPATKIEDGVIRELRFPKNEFLAAADANLVLFLGEEPHIRWGAYADCLFQLAETLSVRSFYFVGSVAAPVPHTREPRMRASVPDERLKAKLSRLDVGYSEYQGPASFLTYLSSESAAHGIEMYSLVVEVPHYPFVDMPAYPKSILRTTAALNDLLDLGLDLSDLERSAKIVDRRLSALAQENEAFGELVAKLEEAYDREISESDEELLKRLMEGINLEDGKEE